MEPTIHLVDNHDGWVLELRRYARRPDPTLRPLVMFPGYAMNTFVLGWHPSGPSMVDYLVDDGFEVWTANLRGQGGSRRKSAASRRYGLRELSLVDLPAALAFVRTETARPCVDAIGCSLGATMIYAYLAHHLDDHGVGAVVAVGGPLRWGRVHPAMRVVFASGRLAGAVPVVGVRTIARRFLPLVKHVPGLLSIYMNADDVDLSAADQLVNTVDDPVPYINRQVARWVRQKDLVVAGVNTTTALRGLRLPILSIYANADGVVPPDAACSVADVVGGDLVTTLQAGNEAHWFAHADMFVNPRAAEWVFEPMRSWLRAHQ